MRKHISTCDERLAYYRMRPDKDPSWTWIQRYKITDQQNSTLTRFQPENTASTIEENLTTLNSGWTQRGRTIGAATWTAELPMKWHGQITYRHNDLDVQTGQTTGALTWTNAPLTWQHGQTDHWRPWTEQMNKPLPWDNCLFILWLDCRNCKAEEVQLYYLVKDTWL